MREADEPLLPRETRITDEVYDDMALMLPEQMSCQTSSRGRDGRVIGKGVL